MASASNGGSLETTDFLVLGRSQVSDEVPRRSDRMLKVWLMGVPHQFAPGSREPVATRAREMLDWGFDRHSALSAAAEKEERGAPGSWQHLGEYSLAAYVNHLHDDEPGSRAWLFSPLGRLSAVSQDPAKNQQTRDLIRRNPIFAAAARDALILLESTTRPSTRQVIVQAVRLLNNLDGHVLGDPTSRIPQPLARALVVAAKQDFGRMAPDHPAVLETHAATAAPRLGQEIFTDQDFQLPNEVWPHRWRPAAGAGIVERPRPANLHRTPALAQ